MKKTQIDIYGRKYTVTSNYEEKYIDHLTGYVNGKIGELVFKNNRLDYADACALCLLNVADDYVTEQQAKMHFADQVNQLNKSYKELHDRLKIAEASVDELKHAKSYLEEEVRKKDNEIIKLKLDLEKAYGNGNKLIENAKKPIEETVAKEDAHEADLAKSSQIKQSIPRNKIDAKQKNTDQNKD
ncbi:MAG: cell division protein ZapA [Ezakiella sp.]|nr:cell division protein ZapA [Ezakiella sp.]MDD7471577.1 cell division protein ZapA [Bacillota bacterium]MDY3922813.1 cell division protein ZapA [Ezakiella sp.]